MQSDGFLKKIKILGSSKLLEFFMLPFQMFARGIGDEGVASSAGDEFDIN
jgi:hypothetical protein